MSTVLVTGAAGFTGSDVVRYRRRAPPTDRVVALDALIHAGARSHVDGLPGVELVHGSTGDTELGWAPTVEWSDGIADTVARYRDHEPWWRPPVGRSPVVEGADADWSGSRAGASR